ncbi:MAG: cation:proton antiporter, partial [Actinomycetota bacterium]|nr:cation:proton antiporter [Actinomycetota bacterium]
MELSFAEVLLFSGALLAISAALSGLFHGTVLSIAVLGVALGVGLAAADVVEIEPGDEAVFQLIELALIVTLFSDGLFVRRELLIVHWSPPVRALALAMPLTLLLLALCAKGLFGELSWAEAFLLAAVLSPTDPVVTSTVVTSQRVPESVRHTLNLESGLNDGLALPFVLFFIVLASPGGDAGSEALDLLGEAGVGALIGIALGLLAGRLTHHLPAGGMQRRYEGIYALGVGLLAFGLADATIGNGFIAAFVCGIALAVADHDIADDFVDFSENVSSILQVVAFFVFGALIVATGYGGGIGLLLVFVAFALLVARPLAVAISFLRVKLPSPHRAFVAWFGPKGVASMLFALFVLNSEVGERALIFEVAAFVILASILAHGLSDT